MYWKGLALQIAALVSCVIVIVALAGKLYLEVWPHTSLLQTTKKASPVMTPVTVRAP